MKTNLDDQAGSEDDSKQDLEALFKEAGKFHVKKQFKEEAELLQRGADQGYAPAQSQLGLLYRHGWGFTQDYKKAIEYFQLSAAQGLPAGQVNLGGMYDLGLGVEQDCKQAAQLYQQAADQGNLDGISNLACLYRDGEGLPQNYKKAAELFHDAAERGNSNAQVCLGHMYVQGEIGNKTTLDYRKAIHYLQKAARQNEADALEMLISLWEKFKNESSNHICRIELVYHLTILLPRFTEEKQEIIPDDLRKNIKDNFLEFAKNSPQILIAQLTQFPNDIASIKENYHDIYNDLLTLLAKRGTEVLKVTSFPPDLLDLIADFDKYGSMNTKDIREQSERMKLPGTKKAEEAAKKASYAASKAEASSKKAAELLGDHSLFDSSSLDSKLTKKTEPEMKIVASKGRRKG